MRKTVLIAFVLLAITGNAQLLSWSPLFIQESSTPVAIIGDATKGNQALKNYSNTTDVYVHIGVITNLSTSSSDWKHVVVSNFNAPNALVQTTYLGNNKWQYTITGGLRSFFGMTDPTEKILKIAILFRNGAGTIKLANTDGSDMYVPVYDNNLYARIDTPLRTPTYKPGIETLTQNIGDAVPVTARASQAATLKIYLNGTVITTATSATQVGASPVITTGGTQTIVVEANNGTVTNRDTISFLVSGGTTIAPLPAGVTDGINYEAGDTSVTLVLYAPLKKKIFVTGDFNNWTPSVNYQMNETPDSTRFWLRIKGLTPGVEYAYQYVIDGSLTVADYNTEKILDKNNDPYIPTTTYPNLKTFPTQATGNTIVSILQTAKPAYNWQVTNFVRPDKRNLIIYELLVRDFIAAGNWQTLKDTLSYLKRLGVNAIEVMPFNEFEGNSSWGYNPSFYFAPDKAYGTETALRQFIDQCHLQGMAVIMDIVMNHSFGTSPMVQMYWDATNNRPAANSPWFDPVTTHAYNVGYQFNHQSQATKDFVDRVVTHWLTKYKIDGFRWDLAKGFTQKRTCDTTGNNCDVNAWGAYDSSRVTTWKRIYDKIQSVSSNAYCILEMFADNSEETVEANYGMMLWGNMNANYNQATMGYSTNADLSYGIYTNRGWSQPNLVTYQESHDEERLMYKNIQYGNASGSYNVKDLNTGLKRNEMATAFWAVIPGPKMLWEFGELGYDYSITYCPSTNSVPTPYPSDQCRTDPKPVHWDYYQNANRFSLYTVYAQLLKLRTTTNYIGTFTTGAISYNLANTFKSMVVSDDSLKVVVVGNFDVTAQTGSVTFPVAGTWYSYLTGVTRTATGSAESITLQPGEYYVYTNRNINNSIATAVGDVSGGSVDVNLRVSPNPVNRNAVISYSLTESGTVNIDVIDISGRKLANLFSGFRARGNQTLPLNSNGFTATALANGIYLLRLQVNGKHQVQKLSVIK